jgi:hypothetical protein
MRVQQRAYRGFIRATVWSAPVGGRASSHRRASNQRAAESFRGSPVRVVSQHVARISRNRPARGCDSRPSMPQWHLFHPRKAYRLMRGRMLPLQTDRWTATVGCACNGPVGRRRGVLWRLSCGAVGMLGFVHSLTAAVVLFQGGDGDGSRPSRCAVLGRGVRSNAAAFFVRSTSPPRSTPGRLVRGIASALPVNAAEPLVDRLPR